RSSQPRRPHARHSTARDRDEELVSPERLSHSNGGRIALHGASGIAADWTPCGARFRPPHAGQPKALSAPANGSTTPRYKRSRENVAVDCSEFSALFPATRNTSRP